MLYFGQQINIHTGFTAREQNENSAELETRDDHLTLGMKNLDYFHLNTA